MKNYIYKEELRGKYVEVPEAEYTDRQKDMKEFVDMLSNVVATAKCGWDGVWYKVMEYEDGSIEKFMVLHVGGDGVRWIPINGNSKGCNLEMIGKSLW